jgi:hypothetical protein
MSLRSEVTKELLEELPSDYTYTYEEAMQSWWRIPSKVDMRLSAEGFRMLTRVLKYPTYEFKIPPVTLKLLLSFNQKIKGPYYIDRRTLYIFNSKQAMLAKLHGDIVRWLSLEVANKTRR